MIAEGFKVFSLEGFYKTESVYSTNYKTESVYSTNPLEFRIVAFLDFSKIYVYNLKTGVAYNLCGNKMEEEMLKKIIIPLYEMEIKKLLKESFEDFLIYG